MRIQMLGKFVVEIEGRDVAAHPWRLRKSRTLVKVLSLAPEQRMHRERLIELLWPERDPSAAANNLHQALYVARRELASSPQDDSVLVLRDGLVLLHAGGPVETDVDRFRETTARAWASRRIDDLAGAIDAYTGELLPEDRFEEWTSGPRDDLRQAFCDLLVAHAIECARVDRVGVAFDSLRRTLDVDPLHEPAVRASMRLLAGQGRRSEALALYERLRHDLAEAYGTDPDPESRRLYRDMLAGSVDVVDPVGSVDVVDPVGSVDVVDPVGSVDLAGSADTVAPEPHRTVRSNLQPALTSFVGRERQVVDVHRELSRARLVTLTGSGGVGKTRLAEEAVGGLVDQYRDGVWVVDLVPVTTSERLPDAVAEAMGLDPAAGADPARVLVARLAARQVLLLLDNCEHLVDACASLVRRLLRECPELRVLTTSREPLHVPGEVTLRVPSLGVPTRTDQTAAALTHEAVRLLVDRARDVRADFRLDDSNVADVIEICRRLDGVPLAIELAAARLAHLEPAEIAERLGNVLTVLGAGDRMTRHATLRVTLEWSHSLLTDHEQVLLRRLSVFAGSFTLRAVEGVCAGGPLESSMILDCLGRVVDKSMVQVERDADRSRYRLLETIRQFGAERLAVAGEETALRDAHGAYFLRLALDHDPDRHPGGVVARPQQLDEEHDNLRAALGWALQTDPDDALLLAVSLWRFWLARGHFVEGSWWLERTLAADCAMSGRERARARLAIAVLDARQGRSARFTELGATAVADMEQVGSPAEVAFTRVLGGFLETIAGNVRAAAEVASRGLAEAETLGAPRVAAAALWLRSLVNLYREDAATAVTCLHETLAAVDRVDVDEPPFLPVVALSEPLIPCSGMWVPVFEETALIGRQAGGPQAPGYVWSAAGSAYRLKRDLTSAAAVVRRSAGVFDAVGDEAGLALALNHLGCIERDLGQFSDARAHLSEALRLRRQLGDRRGENMVLANLGLVSAAAGDFDAGRGLTRVALAQGEEVEDGPGVAGGLLSRAVVELFAGELKLSRNLVGQAAELFRPQGYRRMTGWALQLAAELAQTDGDGDAARRYGAEAAALFTDADCRLGRSRAEALFAGSTR